MAPAEPCRAVCILILSIYGRKQNYALCALCSGVCIILHMTPVLYQRTKYVCMYVCMCVCMFIYVRLRHQMGDTFFVDTYIYIYIY